MTSVCSLLKLWSIALRTLSGDPSNPPKLPALYGLKPNLVARNILERLGFNTFEMSVSLAPLAYMSAVSQKLIPSSIDFQAWPRTPHHPAGHRHDSCPYILILSRKVVCWCLQKVCIAYIFSNKFINQIILISTLSI